MDDKPVVLIVDDAPANIQVLAACLSDEYRVKVATTGLRCLELAVAEPIPDLILLDIEMPGMDGYEVCRRLKEGVETSSTPVIFVTSRDQDEEEEFGLRLGAVDYITKPIHAAIVAVRVGTHVTLKRQRDELTRMALHDQLTGLYNRHYLMEVAEQKMARARRHKHDVSLLMMDIDHFKTINDTHGHPAGDAVLQAVAELLGEAIRKEDVVARFGGEEFVVLLDHCDITEAEEKAESIRGSIEALQHEGISTTISVGATQLNSDKDDFARMLKRADLAVYQAKEQGRNRVVVNK